MYQRIMVAIDSNFASGKSIARHNANAAKAFIAL